MEKAKRTFDPAGTPFVPDHPFAMLQILFGGRRRTLMTRNARGSPHAAIPPRYVTNTEDAYVNFRSKLQQALEEGLRAEGYAATLKKMDEANEPGVNRPHGKAIESVHRPLVPQAPPDLEDLAFEILRLAQVRRASIGEARRTRGGEH